MSKQPKSVKVNVVDARKPTPIAIDLADSLGDRLHKIIGIGCLLMTINPQEISRESLNSTAWTIIGLAREAERLIAGKAGVQP